MFVVYKTLSFCYSSLNGLRQSCTLWGMAVQSWIIFSIPDTVSAKGNCIWVISKVDWSKEWRDPNPAGWGNRPQEARSWQRYNQPGPKALTVSEIAEGESQLEDQQSDLQHVDGPDARLQLPEWSKWFYAPSGSALASVLKKTQGAYPVQWGQEGNAN